MSQWTSEDFANAIGGIRREFGSLVRRMVVSVQNGGTWQMLGHVLFTGKRETRNVETYQGIGFASRPPAGSGSTEAIVINVGGQNNPAAIAMRDEATRAASAGDLGADEAAVYNTLARVRVKKDGTIELLSIAGIGQPTIKGTTYRTAEDTLLTALGVFATALGALNPGTAPAAATTLNTAITAFHAAAASYLTTVVRLE